VVLFPRNKETALYEFIRHNNITTLDGTDPWNLLTEPYLDQSYTPEETQKTIACLGDLGFPPAEVEAIRKKVGPALLAYNSFVWEWVSMGLLEVLYTHKRKPASFYRWAISISKRGYQKAKPCDLVQRRRFMGMESTLWSKFDASTRQRGLWLKAPLYPDGPSKQPAPTTGWKRWFSRTPRPADNPLVTTGPGYKVLKPVFEWLFQQYSGSDRYYHNIYHLEQVVSLLESMWPQASAASLLAAWFHDAIYVPSGANNEEESAEQLITRFGQLNVEPKILAKARDLVLYTKHHQDTADEDERMLHDADLGIFGMHHDAYAKYAADIRKEYASVPEDAFRKGRTEILQQFLGKAEQRGRFFYVLDPIFERQVEANLRWEIAMLNGK
jgi:predicted metal-dependent HD superfamily phosphohydrolase